MDISSTTSSAATITQPEQQVSSQTQKSVQSESSFKEEMNKAEENTQKTPAADTKNNAKVDTANDSAKQNSQASDVNNVKQNSAADNQALKKTDVNINNQNSSHLQRPGMNKKDLNSQTVNKQENNAVKNPDLILQNAQIKKTDTNQLKDKHNKPGALKNKDIADSLESDLLNFNQTIPANIQLMQNNLLNETLDTNIQLMQNNLLNETLDTNIQTLMDANRQLAHISLINNASQVPAKVDYTNIEMGADDAKFFADLVQDTDKTLQNVAADLQGEVEQNVQQAAKNVKVSATLMNALNEAVKTNQPFRINFDKDVSVIIKVDKDGAVSATFIPGDKAVEEYLKQNISFLRQRFDEQELSYRDLSYSRQKQNQEQNRRNNKENDHE